MPLFPALRFPSQLRADGRFPHTVAQYERHVAGFGEWFGGRAGIVARNPARVLRMGRTGKPAPKGMRADDVEMLMAVLATATTVANRRDHALFSFLLGTGPRLSSALALDVADLDLDGGVATPRELKGGGALEVFLRPELVDVLRGRVDDRRRGPVFAGRSGGTGR